MKIKKIIHYSEDDPEFSSDYTSIDLYINDKLVYTYGDYYHDKGQEKIEGFIDCIDYMVKEKLIKSYSLEIERLADYEW